MPCFSPNSLLLGVLNALKNGRLGAGWSGRVRGWLVSHFFSFVSQFFSCVSQAGCLWSGSRPAALFRWPCSISIHLSPRSVTAGVRPFSAGDATFLFICFPGLSLRPPFSAGHAAFLFICFPGLSLVLPPFSAGHVAFLFIYLPCDFFLFVFQVWCLHCCFLPCPLEQVRV